MKISRKSTLTTLCALMIGLFFAVGCRSLAAQDKITFTWQIHEDFPHTFFMFKSTENEPFTINWGDGTIETKICESSIYTMGLEHIYETGGKYTVTLEAANHNCRFISFDCELCGMLSFDATGCSALTNLIFDRCRLTDLDLTGCSALISLICNGNALIELDVSDCVMLKGLYCQNNKLPRLNLENCVNLIWLQCNENQLQLSDLYEIQLLEIIELRFGTQNISPQMASVGEELFSDQAIFNGVFTNYVVYKDNVPAPESDYAIVDGKLMFNTVGEYTVTMTNKAIVSHEDYPAEVIVDIVIGETAITEPKIIDIQIYPNPTDGRLQVMGYELQVTSIEIFDVMGRMVTPLNPPEGGRLPTFGGVGGGNISHLPSGIYFIRIQTEKGVVIEKIIKQ
ncbi:MAG: T9SS type A sorting domain-containing protein [Bacteroidales bacterium]|nr:T9SS type A sorting domain-containing protein [Bacteroidales bacterium]